MLEDAIPIQPFKTFLHACVGLLLLLFPSVWNVPLHFRTSIPACLPHDLNSQPASLTTFVVRSLSHLQLFVTPWTAACQASLSFTISWCLCKFMSTESVMLSNHLVLCCPLLHTGPQNTVVFRSLLPVCNPLPTNLIVWTPVCWTEPQVQWRQWCCVVVSLCLRCWRTVGT